MTFSQLYISSGSQKFYFDFCNNMRTLFTMLGIALWVEIYCRRTVLTDQCAWKPLWRHSNVLLKGDNLCIGMYISVYVLLAVYIKHSKELFLFSNVQNYIVLKALQFRWPVVLFWCWIFFNIAWNMSIYGLVALVSVSAVKIVYRRLIKNEKIRYCKSW